MKSEIEALNKQIQAMTPLITGIQQEMAKSIVGQRYLIDRLLIGLLANGHVLLEGVPGLAKTATVSALAQCIHTKFQRIQFTPDLLPSDLLGNLIYSPKDGTYSTKKGPIFANLILADEINRAPAKVQAALLEAMEERQVTVAGKTHALPPLFMVLATQNPIEQEGTYPLPEAQRDRFLMHVMVRYPSDDDELKIMELVRGEEAAEQNAKRQMPDAKEAQPKAANQEPRANNPEPARSVIPQSAIFAAREEVYRVAVSAAVEKYIVALVAGTRRPRELSEELGKWIHVGGSPRATLALDRAARSYAWLQGRDHVEPGDVQAIAPDCLRHRLLLSYEASADGKTTDDVIAELLKQVGVG